MVEPFSRILLVFLIFSLLCLRSSSSILVIDVVSACGLQALHLFHRVGHQCHLHDSLSRHDYFVCVCVTLLLSFYVC